MLLIFHLWVPYIFWEQYTKISSGVIPNNHINLLIAPLEPPEIASSSGILYC